MEATDISPSGPGGLLTRGEKYLLECAANGWIWEPEGWLKDQPTDFGHVECTEVKKNGDICKIRSEVIFHLLTGIPWRDGVKPWNLNRRGVLIENAIIEGGLDFEGSTLLKQLWFSRSIIKGCINLQDAKSKALGLRETIVYRDKYNHSIMMHRTTVDGPVHLYKNCVFEGEVTLDCSKILGSVDCRDSTFKRDDLISLNMSKVNIDGSVFLDRSKFLGRVEFGYARVNGILSVDECYMNETKSEPEKGALSLNNAIFVDSIKFSNIKEFNGDLLLSSCKTNTLESDGTAWLGKENNVVLDGFDYNKIINKFDKNELTHCVEMWLRQQRKEYLDNFCPQPWVQAAKVLRNSGHIASARKIAYEREKTRSKSESIVIEKIWQSILMVTIGYGYKPHRALFISVILILIGTFSFLLANHNGYMVPHEGSVVVYIDSNSKIVRDKENKDGNIIRKYYTKSVPLMYTEFNALSYSLDAFIPAINLGQNESWEPSNNSRNYLYENKKDKNTNAREYIFSSGILRFIYWFEKVCGWFFVTLFVAYGRRILGLEE